MSFSNKFAGVSAKQPYTWDRSTSENIGAHPAWATVFELSGKVGFIDCYEITNTTGGQADFYVKITLDGTLRFTAGAQSINATSTEVGPEHKEYMSSYLYFENSCKVEMRAAATGTAIVLYSLVK